MIVYIYHTNIVAKYIFWIVIQTTPVKKSYDKISVNPIKNIHK